MFDLNKLGDMAKVANQAKQMQEKQERTQREQTDMLKEISQKMDSIIKLLNERSVGKI